MSDLPPPTGTPSGGSGSTFPRPSWPSPVPSVAVPTGHVQYQRAWAYAKRVGGLAKAIQILVVIVIVGNMATFAAVLASRSTFDDHLAGRVSDSEAQRAVTRIVLASFAVGVPQVAAAVLTMIWMYRLAANSRLFGRPGATWGPGWGIGGWFLPPVLFVIPWLMLRELWKASAPGTVPNDPNWKRAAVSPIVNLWWAVYGLGALFGVSTRFGSGALGGTLDDLTKYYRDEIGRLAFSSALVVVGGIAYLLVVRGLTARHLALTGEA